MTLLLVYPPFAMPDKPYISLPVLAAALKEREVPVALWDANLAFFRTALSPESLKAGNPEDTDIFHDKTLDSPERFRRFGLCLNRISTPAEHLFLVPNTGYIRYEAGTSFFDTRSLIRAAHAPSSLTRRVLADPLARELAQQNPDMVGISVAFPDQILPAVTLAAMIRETAPGVPVVLGGAFVTIHMKNLSNPAFFDLVDVLALGDGEDLLAALYPALTRSRSHRSGLADIPGVMFRDDQGRICPAEPAVHAMAGETAPAYGLLPLDQYLVPRSKGAVLFRLSRGCYWGKCAFCNTLSPLIHVHDRNGFSRTYDNLIATLEKTGAPIVHFTDDAADPDLLSYLADRLVEEDRQIYWTVNARVDKRFTLSLLSGLARAGCFSLFLGIESCCDRVLKQMNKGTTLARITQMLTDLSWAGISANIYMIVGFPTETEAEARASFDQVCQWLDQGLIRQAIYNVFSISPCSDVARFPEKFGITALPGPEFRDLAPPLTDFRCDTGMDRDKARELCQAFITTLSQRRSHDTDR